MVRNLKLYKEVLLHLKNNGKQEVDIKDDQEFVEYINLLSEAKLIQEIIPGEFNKKLAEYGFKPENWVKLFRITHAGHDFLDLAANKEIWEDTTQNMSVYVSFDILVEKLKKRVREAINLK